MRYFLVYLFLEIFISIPIFGKLGVFGTFGEIVLSAFLGFSLLVNSNRSLFANFRQNSLQSLPESLLGAFLLILPGILTDIMGILMQFGILSNFLSKIVDKFKNTHKKSNSKYHEEEIIDVEIIEDKK